MEAITDRSEALSTVLIAGASSILIAALPFIPAYGQFTFLLLFAAFVFCSPVLFASLAFTYHRRSLSALQLRWFCNAIALCVGGFFLILSASVYGLGKAIIFGLPSSVVLYFPLTAAALFAAISNLMIRAKWGSRP